MTEDDKLLGAQLKAAGIARAEGAADPMWKIAAFNHTVEVARVKTPFNSDDVYDRLNKTGEITRENRAFGAIILKAARMGVCKKVQTFPEAIPSRRPQLHKTPLQLWDSLILGSYDPVDNPYESE